MKPFLAFPRPASVLALEDFYRIGEPLLHRAMPSGHTLTAFAVASAIYFSSDKEKRSSIWWIFILAAFAGISRNALGAHWFTDVLAGCAIGLWSGMFGAILASHIPEAQLLNGAAMDCNVCHTGSKTSASGWIQASFNKTTLHNGSQGNGSGWCKACHVTGTNYLGNMDKKALAHDGGKSVKTDCSQSGCHRPIGTKGTSWSKWN